MARPRSFDEDTVVAAARDQFWDRGYAATSVDDLAVATGLGKSSLYGAFGDKRSLFLRTLGEYCDTTTAQFLGQLRDPDFPAFERLTRHIRAMAGDITADTERRGCMMAKSSAELGAYDADVERIVSTSTARWREALVGTIEEAKRDGTIAARADSEALATLLLSVIRGFEALHKGGVEAAQIFAAAEQAVALLGL
jgi:TetR/AcrR family transcriptional regulator, transcriptional repressor for nem operon